VDAYLRTPPPHIFAAGDVTGHVKLVQVARAECRIAALNAVHGPRHRPDYSIVAPGSFTDPEYGHVGLTEAAAVKEHDIVTAGQMTCRELGVGQFPQVWSDLAPEQLGGPLAEAQRPG
jgi:pyruvate/2-oxoglutarate dehydrogenase complex dihydrolipoamide dehydrogenase (E3) component